MLAAAQFISPTSISCIYIYIKRERARPHSFQARIEAPDAGGSLSWEGENGHQGSFLGQSHTENPLTFQLFFKADGMVSRASHFALSLGCPLSSSTSAGVEGGLLSCGGLLEGPRVHWARWPRPEPIAHRCGLCLSQALAWSQSPPSLP